ncbi:MAG: 3'-5' exonuclease [Pseudomonadota bacterium]
MKDLPLRLRVFLFFCLMAGGGLLVLVGGLWLGYRQFDQTEALSAFVTSGIVSGLGVLGLSVGIWLLFDEHVSKPIEALAASLRVRTHAGTGGEIDQALAPYLGDLAPAAAAIHQKLSEISADNSETVAQQTDRLKRHRAQLLQILSDIPLAILVMTRDHQIVLYDGQAADLMAAEAQMRLNGSIFDYIEQGTVLDALARMADQARARQPITVTGLSGSVYSGHIRVFGETTGYTLILEPLDPDAERPPTYDFDLLDKPGSTDLEATSLRDLCLVVFDSETTGLDPETDDVVQLGAVRIVNGRRVVGEVYESLVNPGRPIPARSTDVHGIDDGMVADAPGFAHVCAKFHRFAEGAVIVAHNAPFDMAFLERQSAALGLRFDHVVLDTVHLSAIVFGGSQAHTLDALSARLEVEIPADLRHTAMGDAVATADVLTALIPILEARGLRTLGEVRAEIRKHTRILKEHT